MGKINLLDRLKLEEELTEEIEKCPNSKKALLDINIDDFSSINRIKGYAFGDMLMKKVSKRIVTLFSDEQILYKSPGENFVILIKKYEDEAEVKELAVLILQSFKRPFDVEGYKIYLSAKIGMGFYPKHGTQASELLNQIRTAVYRGKRVGRERIWICKCDVLQKKDNKTFMITQDLYRALENKEFELFYQPQLDLKTKKITGFEALVRWKHPEFDYISPFAFIEIAEKTGQIIPIGEHVLINACIFAKKLHTRGYKDISISVNVSPVQLLDWDFYDNVVNILDFINLEPQYLELEITESVLIKEFEYIEKGLLRLKEKGIKIAIDDFGKGYSSLAYLNKIPADTLKIDKIFVDDILETSKGEKPHILIDSIIILGKNMGLTVLAEGVEEKTQRDYLETRGCDKIQGYYLSKPVPKKEAAILLKRLNPSKGE